MVAGDGLELYKNIFVAVENNHPDILFLRFTMLLSGRT
jgi:hypothetical protein